MGGIAGQSPAVTLVCQLKGIHQTTPSVDVVCWAFGADLGALAGLGMAFTSTTEDTPVFVTATTTLQRCQSPGKKPLSHSLFTSSSQDVSNAATGCYTFVEARCNCRIRQTTRRTLFLAPGQKPLHAAFGRKKALSALRHATRLGLKKPNSPTEHWR